MSVTERFNLKVGDFQLFELPVKKHGTHDQKTHGNWATRNFDEDTDGADAQDIYFSTYGIKTDGSKEPVGVSRDEVSAIDFYTGDGYENINSFLRSKGDTGSKPLTEIEDLVSHIDKVIDESPEIFADKNLFRVYSQNVMDGIKEGDVVVDKGYLSTTRIDITNPSNRDDLENLQIIQESKDVPAIILPSPSGKGKGLAVDYLKNSVQDSPLVTNVATANREKEILLPRRTPLKFMGYKKVNDLEVAVFQRRD